MATAVVVVYKTTKFSVVCVRFDCNSLKSEYMYMNYEFRLHINMNISVNFSPSSVLLLLGNLLKRTINMPKQGEFFSTGWRELIQVAKIDQGEKNLQRMQKMQKN